MLSEFIDCNKWVMNYPYGSYNKYVLKYVEQRERELGLTTEVKIADTDIDNRFLILGLDYNNFPPKSEIGEMK